MKSETEILGTMEAMTRAKITPAGILRAADVTCARREVMEVVFCSLDCENVEEAVLSLPADA